MDKLAVAIVLNTSVRSVHKDGDEEPTNDRYGGGSLTAGPLAASPFHCAMSTSRTRPYLRFLQLQFVAWCFAFCSMCGRADKLLVYLDQKRDIPIAYVVNIR